MSKSIYANAYENTPILPRNGATEREINALLGEDAGCYDVASIVGIVNAIDPATGDCRWLDLDEDGFWTIANSHMTKSVQPTPRVWEPLDENAPAF